MVFEIAHLMLFVLRGFHHSYKMEAGCAPLWYGAYPTILTPTGCNSCTFNRISAAKLLFELLVAGGHV